jgi:SSS family solute:Na+ symporter
VFALSRPGLIVDLAVLSSSLLLPQAPLVIGMFVWKRGGKYSATITIVAGFAVATTLYWLKLSPLGLPMNLWTLIIATLIYVGIALLESPTEGAKKFT